MKSKRPFLAHFGLLTALGVAGCGTVVDGVAAQGSVSGSGGSGAAGAGGASSGAGGDAGKHPSTGAGSVTGVTCPDVGCGNFSPPDCMCWDCNGRNVRVSCTSDGVVSTCTCSEDDKVLGTCEEYGPVGYCDPAGSCCGGFFFGGG